MPPLDLPLICCQHRRPDRCCFRKLIMQICWWYISHNSSKYTVKLLMTSNWPRHPTNSTTSSWTVGSHLKLFLETEGGSGMSWSQHSSLELSANVD